MNSAIQYVHPRSLAAFVEQLFVAAGLGAEGAREVSDCLITANLRGVDSHGVTRVPIYLRRLRGGLVNTAPNLHIERSTTGVSLVDGDNGMGATVGNAGVHEAIRLAEGSGVGAVAVRNSNHFGIAAYYLLKVVEKGHIGLAVTNAPPTMAPFGGREPFLGTNPWAIATPAGDYPAVLVDMATSVVARGKIILAEARGDEIPEGWALDADGRPTTDPSAALRGAVLPFAGPKGSALAIFADVLAGVLAGAAFAPHIKDLYRNFEEHQNVGHFFLVLNVNTFMNTGSFNARMESLVQSMKAGKPAAGHEQILMPGELEAHTERQRTRTGIPLTGEVTAALSQEAATEQVEMCPLSEQPLDDPTARLE